MDQPLSASRMKVQRARQFTDELAAELDRFRASNPVRAMVTEWDNDTLQASMHFDYDAIGLLPGAIIGDAVHNLRTSLDLMASELARLNGKSDKSVYFPFSKTSADLLKVAREKNFHFAGDDAMDLLTAIAPYPGGNDLLAAIHQLDIRDKHTALIPAGSQAAINLAHEIREQDGVRRIEFTTKTIPESIFYVFPPDTPFDGRPVIETLKELVQVVDGILEQFSRLVAARSA